MAEFKIHGARGSMPACGMEFVRYGGHTTCFSIETGEGLLVIDAGTGLSALSDELMARLSLPPVTFLFTHFHLDHIMGFPFFKPLYNPDVRVRVMTGAEGQADWKAQFTGFMRKPFWPVGLEQVPAGLVFEDLPSNSHAQSLYGIKITTCPLRHPQATLAIRLETPGGVVVVATDHEPGDADIDIRLADFSRGADVLIHDAQYTPEEAARHKGWGHGTWADAVESAQRAKVSQLVLTHHLPGRTDDELDAIVGQARGAFENTVGACQNMCLLG